MNASSQCGSSKRPILDAIYAALGVSDVCFAAVGARLFGMRRAGEIRSFAAKQSSALFSFGFFRCNRTSAGFSNFISGLFGSYIPSVLGQYIGMTVHEMFFLKKTLKVFKSVIGFVVVYVMDLFGWVKIFHPAFRHDAMKKVFVAQRNVSVRSLIRRVGNELSKNFSAARYSVKMVKESVFDSVDHYAGHGAPFEAVTSNLVLT